MKKAALLFSYVNSALTKTRRSLGSVRHLSSYPPLQSRKLEGKVAIITGGGSGIGEATAKLFVSHGASVVIADINEQLGSSVAASLGEPARFFPCDVAKEESVSALVDFAISHHGRLDIMYNNAGIIGEVSPDPAPTKLNINDFRRVMDINVLGALLGVKHAARVMMAANEGGCRGCSILFTASLAGTLAGTPGLTSYIISKHAVMGLMKTAAAALAPHGIRVNCVSPTAVMTPLIESLTPPGTDVEGYMEKFLDLKGLDNGGLTAKDVANVALFLSSDDARYISGHNVVIDGAFSVSKLSLEFVASPKS